MSSAPTCSRCGAELRAIHNSAWRSHGCPRCGHSANLSAAVSPATESEVAGASDASARMRVSGSDVSIKIQCPLCMTNLKGVAAAGEKPSSLLRAKMQCPTCASVLSLTVIPAHLSERSAKRRAGRTERAAHPTAVGGNLPSWLTDVAAAMEETRQQRASRSDEPRPSSPLQKPMPSSVDQTVSASGPSEPFPSAAGETATASPPSSAVDPLAPPTEEADAVAHMVRAPAPSPASNRALQAALARDERICASTRLGAISLGLGFVAVALSLIPSLWPLVLIVAGLGLLLGVRSFVRVLHLDRGKTIPALGVAVSLGVLAIAGIGLTSSDPPLDQRILLVPGPGQYDGPSRRPLMEIGPSQWVDASKNAVQQGNARIRLTHAFVPSANGKEDKGVPRALTLGIHVEHTGTRGRFDYRRWSGMGVGGGKPGVRLVDDKGKEYAPRGHGTSAEMEGQVRSASLAPREYVSDTLTFEPPAPRIQFLHLELPAEAIGGSGVFRLEIPRSMIVDYRKGR